MPSRRTTSPQRKLVASPFSFRRASWSRQQMIRNGFGLLDHRTPANFVWTSIKDELHLRRSEVFCGHLAVGSLSSRSSAFSCTPCPRSPNIHSNHSFLTCGRSSAADPPAVTSTRASTDGGINRRRQTEDKFFAWLISILSADKTCVRILCRRRSG